MSNTETNPIRDLVSTIFALRPKHSVVLASLLEGGYAAFDFVPANAEDPKAAVQLLLGADGEGISDMALGGGWMNDFGGMGRGRWMEAEAQEGG